MGTDSDEGPRIVASYNCEYKLLTNAYHIGSVCISPPAKRKDNLVPQSLFPRISSFNPRKKPRKYIPSEINMTMNK